MKRKDCENSKYASVHRRYRFAVSMSVAIAGVLVAGGPDVLAGTVRLWPSAVVVDDAIRLTDLCELGGFDAETELALSNYILSDAPSPGGTRVIHLEMVRAALVAAGTNMAEVTLRGAIQCDVSRASDHASESPGEQATGPYPDPDRRDGRTVRREAPTGSIPTNESTVTTEKTLRQAVQDYFDAELQRYGGTADVVFDRTSEQVLNLSGPTYEFEVRRRKGNPLGLNSVEVCVLAQGRKVQTVPMVVQVAMRLRAAVAQHPVNQGATIRASDLNLVPMSVTQLHKVGISDLARAIGQRAKRFIPVGTVIEPGMLEEVPLVQRGELVTLASVVGGIRVVTTAKAAESGLLGEVIRVRAVDNKRVEFDAVVVGPGAVELSPGLSVRRNVQYAMREGS